MEKSDHKLYMSTSYLNLCRGLEMSGIKESYIANWKNIPDNGTVYKVRVARPSILSPSKELLDDYKNKRIDWNGYEKRFRKEILSNPKVMNELSILKTISKFKDVYLICYEKKYPCHRFILMDMIKELKND